MEYNFIGWCKEGNHDKVWACIEVKKGGDLWVDDNAEPWVYVTVWGRRGKALQHKLVTQIGQCRHINNYRKSGFTEVDDKIEQKKKKGYKPVDVEQLNKVYPEFEEDLKKMAFWAKLEA